MSPAATSPVLDLLRRLLGEAGATALALDGWAGFGLPGAVEPLVPMQVAAQPDAPAPLPPQPAVSFAVAAPIPMAGIGGAQALLADIARVTYDVTGAGIKIGILSDSFNRAGGYADDIARGDLRSGIAILKEGPEGSTDEGRAMAQLIQQVAPGAQMMFYSAFHGEADFAAGILALARAGAKVIVDDVVYLTQPFYQDGGVVQRAVQQVVASGVNYFTSAGNQGRNFYEASFRGVASPLPSVSGHYRVMNFGTADQPATRQAITIGQGRTATLALQWDQPFASIGATAGSANSLGMVLYDAQDRAVAFATRNATGGDPVQVLQFRNTTDSTAFRLAIFTNGGSTTPGLFKYVAYGQGVAIDDPGAGRGSGTLIGHQLVAAANTVGVVRQAEAPRFGGDGAVADYSAAGPGRILFDARGNRLADTAVPGGVDFLATDGVATSVMPSFAGTSAAAPQAAAVAALMLERNRLLSPAQVSDLMARSALAVPGDLDRTGAGLVQATTAVGLAASVRGAVASAPSHAAIFAAAANGPASAAGAVRAALDSLVADPTAIADFTARPDPVAPGPSAILDPVAGDPQAFALLSSPSPELLFRTEGLI